MHLTNFGTVGPILKIQRAKLVRNEFPVDLKYFLTSIYNLLYFLSP